MKKNLLKIFFTLLLAASIGNAYAGSLITASRSGDFFTGSNWNGGVVPTTGDVALIPAPITMTATPVGAVGGVPDHINNPLILIYGTLEFDGDATLTEFQFDNAVNIYVFSGGQFTDNSYYGEFGITNNNIYFYTGAKFNVGGLNNFGNTENFIYSESRGSETTPVNVPSTTGPFTVTSNGLGSNVDGDANAISINFNTQPPVAPPAARTVAAANILSSSATLNGLVSPGTANTTASFDWGTSSTLTTPVPANSTATTPSGGSITVVVGADTTLTAVTLTGLTPNTIYYYRAKGTNSAGSGYIGDILSFTTPVSPTITSATYNAATGVLAVTGANWGAGDTIDPTKLTVTGEGGGTYTLTSPSVTASGTTAFSVTLNAGDKAAINLIFNKNGTSSTNTTAYNLAAAANWDGTLSAPADLTGNGITVSNVAVPAITSATYNESTGALVVTGTGFLSSSGAANDILANKFTFTGDGSSTYTLINTPNVDITSGTSFTLTLSTTDKAGVNLLLNNNGTSSTGHTTYNLAAAASWDAGDATLAADLTGNAITVSNVAVPAITSATYNAFTGVVVVTGTGFLPLSGSANDIVANKFTFTGEGGITYTLTNTPNAEITNSTAFTLTLSAADIAGVNQIINKNGTSSTGGTTYNLAAAASWDAGDGTGAADLLGNGITVSNVPVPAITSATYDASAGALVVPGTGFLSLNGAANDIVASKFTFTGEGGSTYTLTNTPNAEITNSTAFTLTLSTADIAGVNTILNKIGTSSTGGTTYNLAAAASWDAGDATGAADLAGNGITVSNVAVPAITSATYNASTGALVVTGTGFLSSGGAANDIVANKFTFTGDGSSTYTLTNTPNVDITSGTAFTLTLSAADIAAVNKILNKNGTSSTGATAYNLAAAASWDAGDATGAADLTGNGITVSNVAVPAITSAIYNAFTGVMVVTGTGFLPLSGSANDIVANKFTFTGEGGFTYTLTNTPNVDITSSTSFTLSLSATDVTGVNGLLDKNGTSALGGATYNLAAAASWDAGDATGAADLTGNGITATNEPVLTVTGTTTPFSACVNSASTSQSFIVAGSNLESNITVTAPAGFEVSLTSGGGYGSNVTLTPSAGTVTTTSVFVRMAAQSSSPANGIVSVQTTGTPSPTVSVRGTVNSPPTITLGTITAVTTTSTTFSIPYTATTGSPNQYSITTGATALPSFSAVSNTALPASPISVIIPTSGTGTYNFNLIVTNSTTGCASATIPFTLTINLVTPTIQAQNIAFSNVTATTLTAAWTNGNGTTRAVFVKAGTATYQAPTNNTTFTANTTFTSGTQIGATGWYCVYNGTGNSVNITGLTTGTTYSVMVADYNGTAGSELYVTTGSTANPAVISTGPYTLDKMALTSATPAAGGYALRLLSSSYTGPLARITIGSNYYDVYPDATGNKAFSLSSPISVAYNTFNAAATGATATLLSGVIGSSTATVSTWYDQSGNGTDAIQGTTGNQPEIISAGVIDKTNSLPTLKFSGSNWLVVTSTVFNNDLSGSVVFNATSSNSASGPATSWFTMNGIFGSEQPGGTTDFGYGIYNNKFTAGNGASDNSVGGATTVNDGTSRINSWTRTNSSGAIALYSAGLSDGAATLNSGTRAAVPSVAIGAITTGGSVPFFGVLSEITVFPVVYTSAQRQAIESNQSAYYGIAITVPPTVTTTTPATSITAVSATLAGNVSASGGASVTDKGIVYSTTANPTIGSGTQLTNGTGTGVISVNAIGLSNGTTYHFQAYATNTAGTTYGGDVSFTTPLSTISSSGALSALTTTYGTASASTTFNVSGTNMTAGILVTPPSGFEVSADNISFTPTVTVGAAGTIASTPVYVRLAAITATGSYSGNVVLSSAGAASVNVATIPGTVSTLAITITANAQTKAYGTNDPALTYTTSVALVGTDTFSGALSRASFGTLAGEQAGSFGITQGTLALNANYTTTYTGANLTITQATVAVTANAQTKVYGTNDPALTYTNTGLVNGVTVDGVTLNDNSASLTGSLTRASFGTLAGEQAGSFGITQGTLSAGNYAINYTGANLSITTALLGIAAAAETKVYGTNDPALTYTATGLVNGITVDGVSLNDTFSGALSRASFGTLAGEQAGSFAISQGTVAVSAPGNYNTIFTGNNLAITPASAAITANAQTKVYGTNDPILPYASTGLVNGITVDGVTIDDTNSSAFTGALTRDNSGTLAGEQAGSFGITQGTLSSSNYSLTYTGNNLSITTAALAITADAQTKVYGTDDPALTYTNTGLINGVTVDGVSLNDTFSGNLTRSGFGTLAGEQVGSFGITQGTLVVSTPTNYATTYTGANLTITQATVAITADAQTKVYGTNDPALTYNSIGLVNGVTVDGVTLNDNSASLTGSLTRDSFGTLAGEQAGSFGITQGTLSAGNYAINYTGANLSITTAPLGIAAAAETKVYGTNDPTLTYTATGLLNGVTVDGVSLNDTFSGALSRASFGTLAGEQVGSFAISQGSVAASAPGNYNTIFTVNNLAITPAPAAITANAQTKNYGDADPALTYSATGIVNGVTADGVAINDTLTGTLTRTTGENIGAHAITQGNLALSNNYTISFTGSNLIIGTKTITVTADEKNKTYGSIDPALTYTTNVALVPGDSFTGALTRTTGENAGIYPITQGTLTLSTNYVITYIGADLSIGQAALTITADDQAINYGAPIPTLTASDTGLVNGDNAGSLSTAPTITTTATSASLPGTYPITASGAAGANYSISYVQGTLNIIASADATLSGIGLSTGTLSPAFSAAKTSYSVNVTNATNTITITPAINDVTAAAVTTLNGNPVSWPASLSIGQNLFAITVTAQNGTSTKTYTVTVTRAPSSNALLSTITLSPYSSLINTGTTGSTTTYAATVSYATTSVTVTPTTQDANAMVQVNGVRVTSATASGSITLGAEGTATTITTVVTAQDNTTTWTYSIIVTRAPSSNTSLSAIGLSPYSTLISAGTSGSTTTYTATASNATASVSVVPVIQDPNAKITVNGIAVVSGTASGSIALGAEGTTTTITTVVTAQDNTTTRTYSIIVTRAPSSNASLSAIGLSPYSTLISAGTSGSTTTYTATASNATASVSVVPVIQDPNAKITVNGIAVVSGTASGSIALGAEGTTTTITTVVTAQDNTTTRTYSIIVTRAPSSNASLSAIGLVPYSTLTSAGTSGSITTYTTLVGNATASVSVVPATIDPNARIKVNGIAVVSGTVSGPVALGAEGTTTTITTVVTAQDNINTRTYSIIVTRAPSSNASLATIALTPYSTLTNNGTIGSTTNYATSVSNPTTSVTVTPTAQDANAAIKVNGIVVTSGTASGSIALAVGTNTITTTITAQDGSTTRTYSIVVTRATGPLMSLYQPVQPEVSVTKPTETVPIENDGVMVRQGLSPNGDGINDVLTIDGITAYPDNHLTIIDRNGSLIFQAKGYDNSVKAFDGHSSINGRLLQTGTYFYSLDYVADGQSKHKTGYIILKY